MSCQNFELNHNLTQKRGQNFDIPPSPSWYYLVAFLCGVTTLY